MQRNAADTEQVDLIIASLVELIGKYIAEVDSRWKNIAEGDRFKASFGVRELVNLGRLSSLSNSQLFNLIDEPALLLGIATGHLDAIRMLVDKGYSGLDDDDRAKIFGAYVPGTPSMTWGRHVIGWEEALEDRRDWLLRMANELRARL